jgi:hypothetical protein
MTVERRCFRIDREMLCMLSYQTMHRYSNPCFIKQIQSVLNLKDSSKKAENVSAFLL